MEENRIKILGEEFFFEQYSETSEFATYNWTVFYKGFKTITRKKYILFGKPIKITRPVILFSVGFWLTNHTITKSKLKEILEKKVIEYRALETRKEELARGEFI